jgi:hypothetical protein
MLCIFEGGEMKPSRDAWFLIGLFIVLAVLFAVLMGPSPQGESDLSTSYSPGASGVKAFYTLLGDRLGYNVARLQAPYTEMPAGASVLVVVEPLDVVPIVGEERNALERWIRGGGTAIFIADSLKNVPARFGSTRKLGKGFVYAINSRRAVTNKGVRDYRNALGVVDIIAQRARPHDLVLFDEYHHGLGPSKTVALLIHTPRQVKLGVVVIALALLALGYGRGRRFGAVRSLPASESRRPEFEFVESVARLYDRAGATDLAAEILVRSMRQGLCRKLGLSPDAPRQTIARQLESEGREQTARTVDRLLEYEQAGQRLSKSELVHVAREIHSVEKELGIVPIVA